jgi:hypothetical protein
VRVELAGLPDVDDPTPAEDVHRVGEGERALHVLLDDERDPARLDPPARALGAGTQGHHAGGRRLAAPIERVHDRPGGADRLIVRSTGVEHMWVNGVATRAAGADIPGVAAGRLLRG